MSFFHGGVPGRAAGDLLVPSPPHVLDDCPICRHRAAGRTPTVRDVKIWAWALGGARGEALLRTVHGQPDDAPVDPPSAEDAVYISTSRAYARWYAARSQGDLYQVEPLGVPVRTSEDHFPSFTVPAARILQVLERSVRLTRRERRAFRREWEKADRRALTAAIPDEAGQ